MNKIIFYLDLIGAYLASVFIFSGMVVLTIVFSLIALPAIVICVPASVTIEYLKYIKND